PSGKSAIPSSFASKTVQCCSTRRVESRGSQRPISINEPSAAAFSQMREGSASMTVRLGIVLVACFAVLVPTRARAQGVATSFEQLAARVKSGSTIRVTDVSGRKTTGSLASLTASSLDLLVQKKDAEGRPLSPTLTTLSEADVREIRFERRDPVWNGALIGFGIGAMPGLIYVLGAAHGSDPLDDGGLAAQLILVPGAMIAGVGAVVDAAFYEHRTVYRASKGRSAHLPVPPAPSGARAVPR